MQIHSPMRLSLCLVTAWLMAQQAAAQPASPQAAPAAALATAPLADPHAIRVLLSPELETVLAAQMLGRVSSIPTQLGAHVVKGKTLLTMDCSEANARLRMAQAEYAAAKESLDVKERLRKLEAAGDTEVALGPVI